MFLAISFKFKEIKIEKRLITQAHRRYIKFIDEIWSLIFVGSIFWLFPERLWMIIDLES
ncbi:hypothetical protein J6TS2_25900 [Heyndrickxia sporothermodurans]|nr:hypothetical protein J6TS2_25900 [Heyndrickxia sporothermodurans]